MSRNLFALVDRKRLTHNLYNEYRLARLLGSPLLAPKWIYLFDQLLAQPYNTGRMSNGLAVKVVAC